MLTRSNRDTITSHDKKRSYLECLEEYVQWLHEQIRLIGYEPVPLERISFPDVSTRPPLRKQFGAHLPPIAPSGRDERRKRAWIDLRVEGRHLHELRM